MIYSRDSTVYHFDPDDASLLHGTVQSRTGVQQGDSLGPLLFNDQHPPSEYWGTVQGFSGDPSFFLLEQLEQHTNAPVLWILCTNRCSQRPQQTWKA
jgi:hypothetical protein